MLSFQICTGEKLGKLTEGESLGPALIMALFAGVAVYSIHRGIIFSLLEWFANGKKGERWRKRWPLIRNATVKFLVSNWDRIVTKGDNVSVVREQRIIGWADNTHFQFTACWCVIAGALSGTPLVNGVDPNPPLIILGWAFFTSALVSDWRLRSIIDYVDEHPESTWPPVRE